MDAFAGERVQIHRQRRDQRFTFTGLHFGDFAAMEHDAADQLHIEVPHVEDAAAGFANGRRTPQPDVVERGALASCSLEFLTVFAASCSSEAPACWARAR